MGVKVTVQHIYRLTPAVLRPRPHPCRHPRTFPVAALGMFGLPSQDLLKHMARRPIDWLIPEWAASSTFAALMINGHRRESLFWCYFWCYCILGALTGRLDGA